MLLSTILAILSLLGAVFCGFVGGPLWVPIFVLAAAFLIAQRGQ